jgi:outer membrane lipoprotein-sorting protein
MRGITALLIAAIGCGAGSARAEDATEILKKTGENYQNLKSAHFEATTVSDTRLGSSDVKQETKLEVALVKPDKVKVDYHYPNDIGRWLRVSDGKTFSGYRSITKEKKQSPASENDLNILRGTFVERYKGIADNVTSAKILKSEPVNVGGKDIDCWVIEVNYKPGLLPEGTEALPTTYWIDKSRNLVLKQTSGTKSKSHGNNDSTNIRTTTFTVADVNGSVPDTEFAFNPKK